MHWVFLIELFHFRSVTKHSIHGVNIVICYICVIYTMLVSVGDCGFSECQSLLVIVKLNFFRAGRNKGGCLYRCAPSSCDGWIGRHCCYIWNICNRRHWWSMGSCSWWRQNFFSHVRMTLICKWDENEFLWLNNRTIISLLFSMSLNPVKRITFWNIVSSMFVMWTCHITFSQNCVQRLVSLPTLAKAKRFVLFFYSFYIFVILIHFTFY